MIASPEDRTMAARCLEVSSARLRSLIEAAVTMAVMTTVPARA